MIRHEERVTPACLVPGWHPVDVAGRRVWWRTIHDDAFVGGAHLLGLAVWEDPVNAAWEWEIIDKTMDRHLSGGSAASARAALDALMAAAEGSSQPARRRAS
jgi:hypothetical protein